jgi:hypothetical protein
MTDKEEIPDVIGFTQEEGCLILQKGGYRVDFKYTCGHSNKRSRIVRQRLLETGLIELIICSEYYNDPAIEEKEVKKSGL